MKLLNLRGIKWSTISRFRISPLAPSGLPITKGAAVSLKRFLTYRQWRAGRRSGRRCLLEQIHGYGTPCISISGALCTVYPLYGHGCSR